MAEEKQINWPPPPERDASHHYVGVQAVELLAEYRRVKGKKGKYARRGRGADTLDTGRTFGMTAGQPLADMQRRDPVAWAALMEYKRSGAAAGTVTVTAA